MQQVFQDLVVRHLCLGKDQAVDQTAITIHPDMRLHPDMPVVALFRRTHLRVTLALVVLARGWRSYQRGIDHCPFLEQQPQVAQFGIDLRKKDIYRLMLFQQMPELADGGLTRNSVYSQVESDKTAVKRDFVQGPFHGRAGVLEKVQQKVNTKHGFQRDMTSLPFGRWIERLDGRQKLLPGSYGPHLNQRLLLAGLLAALHQEGHRSGQVALSLNIFDSWNEFRVYFRMNGELISVSLDTIQFNGPILLVMPE